MSPKEIEVRLRKGALIRVHPGVYRVGHVARSVEATYLAAVWACGEGALLAEAAAAWNYGIVGGRPPKPTVIAPTERRVAGVKTRRARKMPKASTYKGIPTTTIPRTLRDLAPLLPLDDLAVACHKAGVLHGTTPAHVKREGRTPKQLREVLEGAPVSLSELERRFLKRLEEAGLPRPAKTNRRADSKRVDCQWQHLTVELDSYRFHNSRHSWEQDRRREREAYARGDQFRRYTWRDVTEDPRQMLQELTLLLPAPRR